MHGGVRPSAAPPSPRNLLLALFVVGGVCAGAVGYLGASGRIGGEIPGTYPGAAPSCEGGSAQGSYHFSFVAGIQGRFDFNGTVPGPCVKVGLGSSVEVTLLVDSRAGTNHSWVLIPGTGPTNATPVFPGAGFAGPVRFVGIGPGTSQVFRFNATSSGSFRYVCEVPGHADAGMYGSFTVVSPAAAVPVVPIGLSDETQAIERPFVPLG